MLSEYLFQTVLKSITELISSSTSSYQRIHSLEYLPLLSENSFHTVLILSLKKAEEKFQIQKF